MFNRTGCKGCLNGFLNVLRTNRGLFLNVCQNKGY